MGNEGKKIFIVDDDKFLREMYVTKFSSVGFDVNSVALETAKLNGLITVSSYDDIDDNSVDVVMSNSAIEHTPTPFEDICKLHSKLKVGGKAVFRVPHETIGYKYKQNDWNYHYLLGRQWQLGIYLMKQAIK